MAIIAAFFIFVFYIPIYRTARAKGYPHRPIVITTIVYTAVVFLSLAIARSSGADHWSLDLTWLPISLVLIALQVLPARSGAPGRAWFIMETHCPECGAAIQFDRDRAGLVDSCPRCDEILTVPSGSDHRSSENLGEEATWMEEEASGSARGDGLDEDPGWSEAHGRAFSKDDVWVVVSGYDSTPLAELDQALLEEAGLPTILQPMGPGSAIFGATTLGCQLLVPGSDHERAAEILSQRDADI